MNASRRSAQKHVAGPSAPDFSSVLQAPLVLEDVTLMSYAVLQNRLSLHLRTPIPQLDVAELLTHLAKISAGKYFVRCTLGSLRLPLCIVSVTSTKVSTLLRCRMLKDPAAAAALLPMVGRLRLPLTIGDGPRPPASVGGDGEQAIPRSAPAAGAPPSPLPTDEVLSKLLEETAHRQRRAAEDLLRELTQFTRPDKSVYQGCTEIRQLSVKQRLVVHDRLLRLRDGPTPTR